MNLVWAAVLLGTLMTMTVAAEADVTPLEAQVAAALRSEVRTRFGERAAISVERVQLSIREGTTGSLAVVLAPQAALGAPVGFVVIGAGANGRPMQVGRGTATVTVRVPHAEARRTLARGSVLTAADIADVDGDPGQVPLKRLPVARELVGGAVRRDVAAGTVLTQQLATLPPAVRVGETVQAIAAVGRVQVTADLVAMDNGVEGAIVRVVNRESKRELRARVVRSGVVEVIHE